MSQSKQPLIGHVTLETRDAYSGKLCQHVEGTNFIGQANIEYMKWIQRYLYRYGLSSLGSSDTDTIAPSGPLNCVYLTDSTMIESPNDEHVFPGKLLGWANKSVYAGADILRGTPNVNLLDAQTNYTKWVFDWPTNAANGTIGSVGWANYSLADNVGATPSQTFMVQNSSVEEIWSTPSRWYFFARASDSLAFGWTSGTNISVLDGGYVQSATFSVSGQFTAVAGIAWDRTNNFLWVIGTGGGVSRIAAYNSSGVLQTGPFSPTNRSYKFLAHDGEHLWAAEQLASTTTVTFYRINTTNGTDITNFTTTLLDNNTRYKTSGLAWDWSSNRLWVKISTHPQAATASNPWYNHAFLRAFTSSGSVAVVDVGLNTYDKTGTGIIRPYGSSTSDGNISEHDFDIISKDEFAFPTYWGSVARVLRIRADGLHSRSLLPTPVVKANTQTLRLIYQINYI